MAVPKYQLRYLTLKRFASSNFAPISTSVAIWVTCVVAVTASRCFSNQPQGNNVGVISSTGLVVSSRASRSKLPV